MGKSIADAFRKAAHQWVARVSIEELATTIPATALDGLFGCHAAPLMGGVATDCAFTPSLPRFPFLVHPVHLLRYIHVKLP